MLVFSLLLRLLSLVFQNHVTIGLLLLINLLSILLLLKVHLLLILHLHIVIIHLFLSHSCWNLIHSCLISVLLVIFLVLTLILCFFSLSKHHLDRHINLIILILKLSDFILKLLLMLHNCHYLLIMHINLFRDLSHLFCLILIYLLTFLFTFLDQLLMLLIHLLKLLSYLDYLLNRLLILSHLHCDIVVFFSQLLLSFLQALER